MRLSIDKHKEIAITLLKELASDLGQTLVDGIINADQSTEAGIQEQRKRVAELKSKLANNKSNHAYRLNAIADYLVEKSV